MDHAMVLIPERQILVVFGGFSDNIFYNDTWYYLMDENRWLRKEKFVHPAYPANDVCRNDLDHVQDDGNGNECVLLKPPLALKRSLDKSADSEVAYQAILPYEEQEGYTPSSENSLYFGIVSNATEFVSRMQGLYLNNEVLDEAGNRVWIQSNVSDGTPIAPHAATGPLQYAQLKTIPYNETYNVEVWEWCTHGVGEPTRGRLTDGMHGRAREPVLIQQPRRRSIGWDGCRDNMDWIYPFPRAEHAAVYVDAMDTVFVYGGLGYQNFIEDESSTQTTHNTTIHHDLWALQMKKCVNDCSHHGTCNNGYCQCHVGFYGLNCANVTCPGTSCVYDKNFVQHCTHCCHDGYVHRDDDVFVAGIQKKSCQRIDWMDGVKFTGHSEGICNGFGKCQCAPPFLGDDCSMKDCEDSCSNNGICVSGYPVSRCNCYPGYFGTYDGLSIRSCLLSHCYRCRRRTSYLPLSLTHTLLLLRLYVLFRGTVCFRSHRSL
jgi:hypothetical protein